jgi:hypothetical protein
MSDIRIESPAIGMTYHYDDQFGVYRYSTYPQGSVLAGQESRALLGMYDTLEEAQRAHPQALVAEGCGYHEPNLDHLPDPDGPDPLGDNAAEHADMMADYRGWQG